MSFKRTGIAGLFILLSGFAVQARQVSDDLDELERKFEFEKVEIETVLDSEEAKSRDYLEETREGVTNRVIRLANTVDSLFGSTRAVDEYEGSTLRVTQRYFLKDRDLGAEDVEASLNLKLPNLEHAEDKFRESIFIPGQTTTGEGSGGLKKKSTWDFTQESGIRVSIPISYFARLRARRDFFTGQMVHHFYEQVGWDSRNQWEEKTSLISDYAINSSLLFRLLNEKDWAMTAGNVTSAHGPSLIYQIDDSSAASFDMRLFTGLHGRAIYTDNYTVGTTYRKVLPIEWMYVQLNPEISWPREKNFAGQWAVYLQLELLFGRK